MNKKILVVAVAAISGGGKTAVVNYLKDALEQAEALYFDEYDFVGPEDICEWVENGADYTEWDLSPMVADVRGRIEDKAGTTKYLFLDYPFAYIQKNMSDLIDFTVFVDTPLDVAMARRLIRDGKELSLEEIMKDARNYLLQGREAYLEMLKTVKPNCDLVIDGSLTIQEIGNRIIEEMRCENE